MQKKEDQKIKAGLVLDDVKERVFSDIETERFGEGIRVRTIIHNALLEVVEEDEDEEKRKALAQK